MKHLAFEAAFLPRTANGDYVVVLQADLFEDLNTRAVCLAVPEGRTGPGVGRRCRRWLRPGESGCGSRLISLQP